MAKRQGKEQVLLEARPCFNSRQNSGQCFDQASETFSRNQKKETEKGCRLSWSGENGTGGGFNDKQVVKSGRGNKVQGAKTGGELREASIGTEPRLGNPGVRGTDVRAHPWQIRGCVTKCGGCLVQGAGCRGRRTIFPLPASGRRGQINSGKRPTKEKRTKCRADSVRGKQGRRDSRLPSRFGVGRSGKEGPVDRRRGAGYQVRGRRDGGGDAGRSPA